MTSSDSSAAQDPTAYTAHLPIFKEAGAALVGLGLLDIAALAYCIHYNIAYTSSFNIFAVIAGLLLLGGSLRTASVVRWFSVFMLSSVAIALPLSPLVQPLDLTLVQVRNAPVDASFLAVFYAAICALWALLAVALGKPEVHAARAAAGRRRRDMRIPGGLGAGLALLAIVGLSVVLNGESAEKAKALAQEQAGPDYRYSVRALNFTNHSVAALVTAWNDREVRQIPVTWTKP